MALNGIAHVLRGLRVEEPPLPRDLPRRSLVRAHATSLVAHVALIAAGLALRGRVVLPAPPAPSLAAAAMELDLVAPSPARSATLPVRVQGAPSAPSRRAPRARAAAPSSTAGAHVAPSTQAPPVEPPPARPVAPQLPSAGQLLRGTRDDVMRVAGPELLRVATERGDDPAVLRRMLDRSLREALVRGRHDNVAGSLVYYRPLQRAAQRTWRPREARTVSVEEGAVGSVVTGPEGFRRVQEAMDGTMAPTRRSAAEVAANEAHLNSPMLTNPAHPTARAEATARTTRAALEVEQDATARVLAARIVESSGIPRFDASAREAIVAAIEVMEPRRMPGGWRSRWLLEVTHTRTPPPVGFLPSLPDEGPRLGPSIGGTFDEVTGEVRAAVPFALNERRVVRLLWSEVIERVPASQKRSGFVHG